MEGVISMGTTTSPDLLYKSGSVVQMGYSTQVTGSFNATNLSSATGNQDIKSSVSASLNLTTANVWYIEDDNNPTGGHIDVNNLINGEQVTIIWNNIDLSVLQSVTVGSNIVVCGSSATSFNVNGGRATIITGAVYNGTLYLTPII
jgi:hypothetical protein